MGSKKDSPATALDASVIVAGLLFSHQHHKPAAAALSALLAEPGDVILPGEVEEALGIGT